MNKMLEFFLFTTLVCALNISLFVSIQGMWLFISMDIKQHKCNATFII